MNDPVGLRNTAVYSVQTSVENTEAAAQILWRIMPLSIARDIMENAIESPRFVTICEPLVSELIEIGCTVKVLEV